MAKKAEVFTWDVEHYFPERKDIKIVKLAEGDAHKDINYKLNSGKTIKNTVFRSTDGYELYPKEKRKGSIILLFGAKYKILKEK